MSQYSILHNTELCVGCQACEIACKQENNITVGPRWIRIIQVGPKEVGGKLRMDFVMVQCRHCTRPACRDACPVDAITRRADGIVLIDAELCIGCDQCIEACPFGAPQLNPETNLVEMCTLCVHRIDNGLEPACVQACPYDALRFGDMNSLIQEKREKYARSMT